MFTSSWTYAQVNEPHRFIGLCRCGRRPALAHVAQSVEHLHGKEKVIGSIPIVGSSLSPSAVALASRPEMDIPNIRTDLERIAR